MSDRLTVGLVQRAEAAYVTGDNADAVYFLLLAILAAQSLDVDAERAVTDAASAHPLPHLIP